MSVVDEYIPFLGRMIVEVDPNEVKKKLGVSVIALTDDYIKQNQRATREGKVLKIAEDAFTGKFSERYGRLEHTPKVGDIVVFVPYETFPLDKEGLYHILADVDVIAIKVSE